MNKNIKEVQETIIPNSTESGPAKSMPRVKKVFPLHDYWLLLFFENGEIRLYDCAWALRIITMEKLHKMRFFKKVRVIRNGIKWNKNIEMGTEELYGNSTPLTDFEGNLLKLL